MNDPRWASIDAFAEAAPGQASCVSASRCELAMTPYRRCRHPYPAYFAENTLYLSPELEKAFPDCRRRLAEEAGRDVPAVRQWRRPRKTFCPSTPPRSGHRLEPMFPGPAP